MSFKTDLINDLDTFINTNEFAVDVIYQSASASTTIKGIFDSEFASAVEDNVGIETPGPEVLVKTSDITGALHGETMTINSIVYNITGIQPDGTGFTVVLLSED